MRYLILTVIGLFFVLQPNRLLAQNRPRGPACPTIRVECPKEVEQGNMMVCSAYISGLDDLSGLRFKWSVSTGVITKGKDSDSVVIEPIEAFPGVLSATVEVNGLPSRSCPKTASSSSRLYVKEYSSTKIEEYGDVSFDVERNYLDVMAQRLRDVPGSRPWIISYAGRFAYENEAMERAERAKRYLVEKHGGRVQARGDRAQSVPRGRQGLLQLLRVARGRGVPHAVFGPTHDRDRHDR